MKILDCTLRDGGYYTNWDFDQKLVKIYLDCMEKLPVDILEIGYRNPIQQGYQGEYFYCPLETMQFIRKNSTKELAILIDEKQVNINNIKELLQPCSGLINLVRIAVKPENVFNALELSSIIKKMNFKVALNVMYLSKWNDFEEINQVLPKLKNKVDYFYLVDSYGSIFPEELISTIKSIQKETDVSLGFHGHNNIELALINTLEAINNNCAIVDATITGMGRGAGNLKLELLLSVLNKKNNLKVDYNYLTEILVEFKKIKEKFNWGTSLPYMVSGINSLPQKDVMEWVSKKYYSINSIIRALNQNNNKKSSYYNLFSPQKKYNQAIIVGGGFSVNNHLNGILNYINQNDDLCIIHASSKNAIGFKDITNSQYFCLVGNEGIRIKKVFKDLNGFKGKCILPPSPRKMGTFVPEIILNQTYELSKIDFTNVVKDSHLAIALQTALELDVKDIYLVGFDGYLDGNIQPKDRELFIENNNLFKDALKVNLNICSITPSLYKSIPQTSIYKLLT